MELEADKEIEMEAAIEPEVSTALELVSDIHMARAPERVLSEAREAARALRDVLANKKNKFMLRGEQYLQFEDWQTLGRFYGVTARIKNTQQVTYGESSGFEAIAEAVRADGLVISAAEAMCMDDEVNWKGKPIFQLRSMAQTRACAKALRNVLSWVAVLAGYAPTPAEEMSHDDEPRPACPECGKTDSVIKGRVEYGGGLVCFKKKGGCGAKFTEDSEPQKTTDQALRDELFNQAEKLMGGMDADKRKEALGRLLLLPTEDMGKKVQELAETVRAKTGKLSKLDQLREARIKSIRDEFKETDIQKVLDDNWEGSALGSLSLDALDAVYADLIPF